MTDNPPALSQRPETAAASEAAEVSGDASLIEVEDLSLFYGANQALKNISMRLPEKIVTAFIGPSGCGKSTLLRCFNRMNDLIDGVTIHGGIRSEEHTSE